MSDERNERRTRGVEKKAAPFAAASSKFDFNRAGFSKGALSCFLFCFSRGQRHEAVEPLKGEKMLVSVVFRSISRLKKKRKKATPVRPLGVAKSRRKQGKAKTKKTKLRGAPCPRRQAKRAPLVSNSPHRCNSPGRGVGSELGAAGAASNCRGGGSSGRRGSVDDALSRRSYRRRAHDNASSIP